MKRGRARRLTTDVWFCCKNIGERLLAADKPVMHMRVNAEHIGTAENEEHVTKGLGTDATTLIRVNVHDARTHLHTLKEFAEAGLRTCDAILKELESDD